MPRIRPIIAVLLLLATMVASPALAAEWIASRVTQPVKFSTNGENWADLKRGMDVPNAAWIQTGTGGRVLLRRENDTIMIASNTKLALTKTGSDRKKTSVRQVFGRVDIDLVKRNYSHFSVQTPFMAVIVKGTKFTVQASPFRTSLAVSLGLVEARDLRTGAKAQVGAGAKALVEKDPRLGMTVSQGGNVVKISSGTTAPGAGNTTGSGATMDASVGVNTGANPGANLDVTLGDTGVGIEVDAGGLDIGIGGLDIGLGSGGLSIGLGGN